MNLNANYKKYSEHFIEELVEINIKLIETPT